MQTSQLDLNLLSVFEAVYTEGGVTKAADRLNLTQPAISHSLRRLRDFFGDPLFQWQGQVMAPTPLARAMIEPVRLALRTISDVIDERGGFDARTASRRFVIGLRDVMESDLLLPLMSHVAREAPGVDLASVRIFRGDLERDLASGTLDVAIDILMPLSKDVRHRLILSDRLVVVARQGHPSVCDGLTLETYLQQEHILVTSRREGLGLADLEVAAHGKHRKIRLRCQQNFAALRVVSETDLVLTIPARLAQVANLVFENQIIAAPFDKLPQDSYLYWHSNVDSDPANQWLRDQMFAAFGASQTDHSA
jgi:DNA-binding transcriptional LysR family regulator